MHHCLFITEILYLICEEIWSGAEQRHKTLATMARCCRAFEAPALDVLWRAQDSLQPLLACLPADIWQERDGVRCLVRCNGVDSVGRQKYSPSQSRAVNPADMIRFDRYAKRINMLTVTLSKSMADIMETLSRTGSLFPNLHNLGAWIEGAVSDTSVDPLLVPSLKALKIRIRSGTEDTSPMFSNLALKCPAVVSLRIFRGRASQPLSSEHICCWKDLHSLSARLSDSRALTHLSTMRSLSVLNIHLPIHLESEQFTFRTLKKLVIRARRPSSCIDFLCSLRAPSLVSLAIRPDNCYQRWEHVFEVIGQRLCDSPLSEISLGSGASRWTPMDRFRPLYIFADMTTFVAHIFPQSQLDDNGIREMASAWPNLRTLRLPSAVFCAEKPVPHVSLGGLAFLVQTCQNLTRLELEIDARICVDPLPHPTTPNVLMREMDLQTSPIEDAERVAAFLARVLPNLRKIKTGPHSAAADMQSHHRQWVTVSEHLVFLGEQGRVLSPPVLCC
jgi:hypothetical protein